MDAKIIDGRIAVNVSDLVDCLSDEDKDYIIEMLSCNEKVIENVASQIVTGWTEGGSHGFRSFGHTAYNGLDKARRLLAKSASEVSGKEIERLESECKRIEQDKQRILQELFELERKYDNRFAAVR